MTISKFNTISIVTVNYNTSSVTCEFIISVLNSIEEAEKSIKDVEIIVVDNNSDRCDYNLLKHRMSEISEKNAHSKVNLRLIRLSKNYGYAPAINLAVRLAKHELIVISNPDVILEKNFFKKLMEIVNKLSLKLVNRIMIAPMIIIKDTRIINSSGLLLHVAGYGILRNLLRNTFDRIVNRPSVVLAPHGALFIATKKILTSLGPFNPSFTCFLEDLDFGIRAFKKKYYTIYLPHLKAYHHWGAAWGRELSREKFYYVERNRFLVLLENFHRKELIALTPIFLTSECISMLYSIVRRYLTVKIKIYADLIKLLPAILKNRGTAISIATISRFITFNFNHVIFNKLELLLINNLFRVLKKFYKLIGYLKNEGGNREFQD